MIKVDAVIDLSRGDCGKGKVSHHLISKYEYTHSLRFNGGGNAGHTIYHNGQKFVTHQIPAGVFYGIRSVIGPGCVVNPSKLLEEIEYLEKNGIPTKEHLRIAQNAHVVTEEHLRLDGMDSSIGTTKTGNGPCYIDKYARKGIRAIEVPKLKEFCIDMHEEFYSQTTDLKVLAEGAQGFYLDVDWGKYPYVTSSHCGIGGLLNNGFTHKQIDKVYGVVKAYETYVGADKFEGDDPIFAKIRELGQEYGATTGRPRQCNWLSIEELIQAVNMTGIDTLIINKIDILNQLGVWKLRSLDNSRTDIVCSSEAVFKEVISQTIKAYCGDLEVIFSSSPERI